KDGQTVSGILVEATATKLTLRIAGIPATFPASTIDRYRLLPPVLERYEEMRRVAGEDAEQLVRLAEWLRARERYELAYLEADRADKIDPNNGEAGSVPAPRAKETERKKKGGGKPAAGGPPPGVDPKPAPPNPRDFPL